MQGGAVGGDGLNDARGKGGTPFGLAALHLKECDCVYLKFCLPK